MYRVYRLGCAFIRHACTTRNSRFRPCMAICQTWSPARFSTDTLRAALAQGPVPLYAVDRTLHEVWQTCCAKFGPIAYMPFMHENPGPDLPTDAQGHRWHENTGCPFVLSYFSLAGNSIAKKIRNTHHGASVRWCQSKCTVRMHSQ